MNNITRYKTLLLTLQDIKWRKDGRMRQWRIRGSQNSFGNHSNL